MLVEWGCMLGGFDPISSSFDKSVHKFHNYFHYEYGYPQFSFCFYICYTQAQLFICLKRILLIRIKYKSLFVNKNAVFPIVSILIMQNQWFFTQPFISKSDAVTISYLCFFMIAIHQGWYIGCCKKFCWKLMKVS